MRSSRFLYPGIDCSSRESSLRPRVESPFNWNSKNIPVSAGVTSVFVAAKAGCRGGIVCQYCNCSLLLEKASRDQSGFPAAVVILKANKRFDCLVCVPTKIPAPDSAPIVDDWPDKSNIRFFGLLFNGRPLCLFTRVQIGKVKYSTLIIGVFNAHLASIAPVSIRLPFKGASGSEVFAKF